MRSSDSYLPKKLIRFHFGCSWCFLLWLLVQTPAGAQEATKVQVSEKSAVASGGARSFGVDDTQLLSEIQGDQANEAPFSRQAPRKFRWLRNVGMTAIWLPGDGDDFGMTDFRFTGSVFLPVPALKSALVITPSFTVDYLNGPVSRDLPPRLYLASASFFWMSKPTKNLQIRFGVSPTIASDFEASNNAFRLPIFAVVTYQWNPEWQFLLGVTYLDRNDVNVLPIAGAIWTPTEDVRVELTIPRPRLAKRIWLPWDAGLEAENWVYLAGELGGGTWAIRRTSGVDDEVTLRDFRILLGWERKMPDGINFRLEGGYVFGRRIEYESDTEDLSPSDAIFLRAGWTF
ncbi:MAG: hypothetical protein ACFCD0_15225 [Gemmataceae bacterium]